MKSYFFQYWPVAALLFFILAVLVILAVVLSSGSSRKHPYGKRRGKKRVTRPAADSSDGFTDTVRQEKYRELYCRLEQLCSELRPYLDPKLRITDVARLLYTNKAYVSRAVYHCAGMNFCQYLNRYRVKYAKELFDNDPTMRVSDMANASGFNSLTSFNIAFRANENISPAEWCKKQRNVILSRRTH